MGNILKIKDFKWSKWLLFYFLSFSVNINILNFQLFKIDFNSIFRTNNGRFFIEPFGEKRGTFCLLFYCFPICCLHSRMLLHPFSEWPRLIISAKRTHSVFLTGLCVFVHYGTRRHMFHEIEQDFPIIATRVLGAVRMTGGFIYVTFYKFPIKMWILQLNWIIFLEELNLLTYSTNAWETAEVSMGLVNDLPQVWGSF